MRTDVETLAGRDRGCLPGNVQLYETQHVARFASTSLEVRLNHRHPFPTEGLSPPSYKIKDEG